MEEAGLAVVRHSGVTNGPDAAAASVGLRRHQGYRGTRAVLWGAQQVQRGVGQGMVGEHEGSRVTESRRRELYPCSEGLGATARGHPKGSGSKGWGVASVRGKQDREVWLYVERSSGRGIPGADVTAVPAEEGGVDGRCVGDLEPCGSVTAHATASSDLSLSFSVCQEELGRAQRVP